MLAFCCLLLASTVMIPLLPIDDFFVVAVLVVLFAVFVLLGVTY